MNNPPATLRPQAADPLLGQHVGSYRITRELGRGGMGVVYLAVHQDIGQHVAIKVLSARHATHAEHVTRFLQGARAGSLIRHPGLVQIFDFGRLPDGRPYLMMEYLSGERLRERLQRLPGSRLPPQLVLPLGRQLAGALAALHAGGALHCDLKPENIVLIPDAESPKGERAKIVDFGIARLAAARGAAPELASGARLGTPAYMSPEQCLGQEELTDRSDVYSLGVVLYEALCGEPPFLAPSAADLVHKQVFELPLPPGARNDRVTDELSALVLGMLGKQPALRPSAVQVLATLARLDGSSDPAGATPALSPSAPGRSVETESDQDVPQPPITPASSRPAPVPALPRAPARRWPVALALALLVGLPGALWQLQRAQRSMVHIPSGSFVMGSASIEVDAALAWARQTGCTDCVRDIYVREQPAHTVSVSAFDLDATEVTNEQYAQWLNQQPALTIEQDDQVFSQGVLLLNLYPAYGYGGIRVLNGRLLPRPGMERMPVTQVTWEGARRYCAARNKRLPTEAEWEYAARGEQGHRFPWGDSPPQCEGVVFGRESQEFCVRTGFGPAPVGSARQDVTPLGVYDLGGSVAEWVMDCFQPAYAPCPSGCRDPQVLHDAADANRCSFRVVRGGAWFRGAEACRSTGRGRLQPDKVTGDIGFRCAQSEAR